MTPRLDRATLSRLGVRLPEGGAEGAGLAQGGRTGRKPGKGGPKAPTSSWREQVFLHNLRAVGVIVPIPEYRFHPVRKHRLDYAWPDAKLGLEVEGGVWTRGKHGRGSGIVKDMEKANLLACAGWRLLRVTPDQLTLEETAAMVKAALNFQEG